MSGEAKSMTVVFKQVAKSNKDFKSGKVLLFSQLDMV